MEGTIDALFGINIILMTEMGMVQESKNEVSFFFIVETCFYLFICLFAFLFCFLFWIFYAVDHQRVIHLSRPSFVNFYLSERYKYEWRITIKYCVTYMEGLFLSLSAFLSCDNYSLRILSQFLDTPTFITTQVEGVHTWFWHWWELASPLSLSWVRVVRITVNIRWPILTPTNQVTNRFATKLNQVNTRVNTWMFTWSYLKQKDPSPPLTLSYLKTLMDLGLKMESEACKAIA